MYIFVISSFETNRCILCTVVYCLLCLRTCTRLGLLIKVRRIQIVIVIIIIIIKGYPLGQKPWDNNKPRDSVSIDYNFFSFQSGSGQVSPSNDCMGRRGVWGAGVGAGGGGSGMRADSADFVFRSFLRKAIARSSGGH